MESLIPIQYLDELVLKYKTASAKKAALTREIKALTDRHHDLQEAYDHRRNGCPYGWFLGDKIFGFDVVKAKKNIDIVTRFKNEKLSK